MSDGEKSGSEPFGAGDVPDAGPLPPEATEAEDALRSLERLAELARGDAPPAAPPVRSASAPRRKRPRVVGSSRPAQTWARIAAPVAFLVAVIVVVSLAFQSGVVGGGEERPAKPVAKASKTGTKSAKPTASGKPTGSAPANPGATRTHTVKAGDTLSGIAQKYDVSVTEIEALNPEADLTTLQPGQKLKIPPR